MITLVKAWKAGREQLTEAGIDQPAIDARLMLEAAAGVSRVDIITDPQRELTEEQASAIRNGEKLERIVQKLDAKTRNTIRAEMQKP